MKGRGAFVRILLLWGAGLGAAAQFGKIAVIFDRFAAVYPGHGAVVLGLTVSVVGIVGLIFGTTAGLFVQRLGPRRVLAVALVAGGGVSLVQAMLPPLPVLLGLRVLEGFSHLGIVVAAPVLIAQLATLRMQGFAMTLWSSFFGISFALTALFGLPLVEARGAGALFLVHGVYMLGFGGLLWAVLPRDAVVAGAWPRDLWRAHRTIYASAHVAAPALGFFCYTLTYVALLTLLPPVIDADGRGLATAFPLVSIAVSLTFGVWALRLVPAWRLVQIGFAAAVLAAGAIWALPGLAFWAALVLGGALGVVQGASFAAIAQLNTTPDARAQSAGAIAQLGNLGTTSGTPLLALLLAGFGEAGLALFVVLPSLLGIALHQGLARRRARLPG